MRSGVGSGPVRRPSNGPATRSSLRREGWRSELPKSSRGRPGGTSASVIIGLPVGDHGIVLRRPIAKACERPGDAGAGVFVQSREGDGEDVGAREVAHVALDNGPAFDGQL